MDDSWKRTPGRMEMIRRHVSEAKQLLEPIWEKAKKDPDYKCRNLIAELQHTLWRAEGVLEYMGFTKESGSIFRKAK